MIIVLDNGICPGSKDIDDGVRDINKNTNEINEALATVLSVF